MRKTKKLTQFLWGNFLKSSYLEDENKGGKDNIKMDHREEGCVDMGGLNSLRIRYNNSLLCATPSSFTIRQ
jgi:hypothetical protein